MDGCASGHESIAVKLRDDPIPEDLLLRKVFFFFSFPLYPHSVNIIMKLLGDCDFVSTTSNHSAPSNAGCYQMKETQLFLAFNLVTDT